MFSTHMVSKGGDISNVDRPCTCTKDRKMTQDIISACSNICDLKEVAKKR